MAVVKKANVSKPTLPKETVEDVKGLGGDVVVCGLLLSDRNKVFRQIKEDHDASIPQVLSNCVLDVDGERLFTVEDWQNFGATDEGFAESIRLFNVAFRLSGLDGGANEKK